MKKNIKKKLSFKYMHKTRILTLQQISESENKYINENSEEKILSIAGKQIAKF